MTRGELLKWASDGLAMPIGTDLLLHECTDPEAVRRDGRGLGGVVVASALRWQTPLAIPLMDLRTEKSDLLAYFGVHGDQSERFHFTEPPEQQAVEALSDAAKRPFPIECAAQHEALRVVCEEKNLVAVGMAIGPLSLATKLMADPIPGIAFAARDLEEEEPLALTFRRCLEMAELTVKRAIVAQLCAGAKAILICEPSAGIAYLSPRQMRGERHCFHRFVLEPHLRLRQIVRDAGAEYFFHDCGELTDEMVRLIGWELHPAMLSLGSSRSLWEDAQRVPGDVVLFGNLPTRQFYSDAAMPAERVMALTMELRGRMTATKHPFILGSECDVLHVPDAAGIVREKVDVMLRAARGGCPVGEGALA